MKIALTTTQTSQPVQILASEHLRFVPGGMTIDADLVRADQYEAGRKIVKVGTRLAKVTATGLYAPVRSSTLAVAALATDATLTLVDARFVMAGDVLDASGTNVTVQSVNYATNVVTLTGQIGAAKALGATVKGTGGLGIAVAILYPDDIDVTDGDEAVGGIDHARIIETRVPGTVSASEKTDLKEIAWA